MSGDITAQNAILTLTIASLYTAAQRIQGFATDEAFNFPDVEVGEFQMGVDGNLSGGAVPVMFPQEITLQADSESCVIFEQWNAAQRTAGKLLQASGTAILPATGRQYKLTKGFLRGYSPAPAVRKILQPRKFTIVWNFVAPSAYVGL